MLKGSLLCGWWSGVAENQIHSSFYGCRITCKNEVKIQSENEALDWAQHYLKIAKTLKGSEFHKRRWGLAEILTYSSFYRFPYYQQEWRRSIQK